MAVEGFIFPSGSVGPYLPLLGDLGGGDALLGGGAELLGDLGLGDLSGLDLVAPRCADFLRLFGHLPHFYLKRRNYTLTNDGRYDVFFAFNSSQIMDALKLISARSA